MYFLGTKLYVQSLINSFIILNAVVEVVPNINKFMVSGRKGADGAGY